MTMRAAAAVSRVLGRWRRRSQGCSHSSARLDNLKRPWSVDLASVAAGSVECEVDGEGAVSLAGPQSLECNRVGQLEAAVVSRVRGRERRRCHGRGQSSARADKLNVTRVKGRTTWSGCHGGQSSARSTEKECGQLECQVHVF